MTDSDVRGTHLVALVGAVTPPGRLSRAIAETSARARASALSVREINLADLEIGFADGRELAARTDDAPLVIEALQSAQGVVLATPVYRASITGALKNVLDLAPVAALRGKPVGIVAMGGSPHHYLGASSHLRDVLAWFGALLAPTDVYLTSADFVDGAPSSEALATLEALFHTVAVLASAADGLALGPPPLAAKYY